VGLRSLWVLLFYVQRKERKKFNGVNQAALNTMKLMNHMINDTDLHPSERNSDDYQRKSCKMETCE